MKLLRGREDFKDCFNTASGKYYCNFTDKKVAYQKINSFNTASGKYYCNLNLVLVAVTSTKVSIPQAVSTIAIQDSR